MERTDAWEMDI